jgi:hypothetical protein
MLKLTEAELDDGLAAIKFHGYSDFFPQPPEFKIISDEWPRFRTYLASVDLDQYKAYHPPLELSAPKSRINVRRVSLLHPFDLIIYSSIVRLMRDNISRARVEEKDRRVFSFRSEGAPAQALYKKFRPSHGDFSAEVLKRAQQKQQRWMVLADIADFYYRLYQHKVRNSVEATVTSDRERRICDRLEKSLLRRFTGEAVSFGIPIGPPASRLLAEAAITDVDKELLSLNIDFLRYIDDYVIFAKSRHEAEWTVRQLAEILYRYHGLTLQTAKTQIVQCADYISEHKSATAAEDEVEQRFNEIVEEHFYDVDSFDELTAEQKETIDALDFAAVLQEALDEEPPDYKKINFVLGKLSALENEDLIEIVLDNLEQLYPVAHAVNLFFREFEHLSGSKKKRIADTLLKPIMPDQSHMAPEYYAVWILDLFSHHVAWDHAGHLLRIFRDTQSQTVKRYAALAIGNCGSRSEALPFKQQIASATPLTRTAILIASSKLPRDERKYWRQNLGLTDALEKDIP